MDSKLIRDEDVCVNSKCKSRYDLHDPDGNPRTDKSGCLLKPEFPRAEYVWEAFVPVDCPFIEAHVVEQKS